MTTARIVLTGSTGGLGSSVFKHILKFVDPATIIVSLYNPSKAPASISESGVEVRKGNYSQPETLDTAFAGGEILFLVSYPSIAHELRVKNHINAIDAAKRAGIKHIVYTSLAFAGSPSCSESAAAVMRAHIDTESYLQKCGLKYTIVREGIYSESYPLYLGFFDPSGTDDVVSIPQDGNGGIAWACRDDLGEATARILTTIAGGSSECDEATLLLSGPVALALRDVAKIVSEILGRRIKVQYVEVDEYATSSTALAKLGPEFAKLWATTYDALSKGECDVTTPTLQQLLGRPPRTMRDVLKELLKDLASGQSSIDQYAK